jgi:hypothetical protein
MIAGAAIAAMAISVAGYKAFEGSDSPDGHHATETPGTPTPNETPTVISPEDREAMRASTVEIAFRDKNAADAPWLQNCTGTKVSIGGQNYVVTARHCLKDSMDVASVFPSMANTNASPENAPDLYQAEDVTDITTKEFGIWNLDADGIAIEDQVAPVEAISVRYYPDMALMKVDESSPGSAAYNALPAIAYESMLDMPAVPGSQAVLFGIPLVNGGKMIKGEGVYLGRAKDPTGANRQLDFVGINPSGVMKDACNFGASGTAAKFASGAITGPLSQRNNIVNEAGSNGTDDKLKDIPDRQLLEKELGVNTQEYSTVCGFSVVDKPIVEDMVQGFDNPVQLAGK